MLQYIVQFEPLLRIAANHASNKILSLGRHKRRNVIDALFDFFEQLPEIVIVEGQCADLC